MVNMVGQFIKYWYEIRQICLCKVNQETSSKFIVDLENRLRLMLTPNDIVIMSALCYCLKTHSGELKTIIYCSEMDILTNVTHGF